MNGVGIAPAVGAKKLTVKNGDTGDIINEVLSAIPGASEQTRDFSRRFEISKKGLKDLFLFVRDRLEYKEDPLGVQWVKTPARLWRDGVGDCKSYTIFIASVLENMGIDYIIRFSNTQRRGSKIVNHVYPIAVFNGEEIILDAVYKLFNREAPYYYIKNYTMADIYRLSGIGSAELAEVNAYWDEIKKLDRELSDEVLTDGGGDITAMPRGDFMKFQQIQFFQAQADTANDEESRIRFEAAADAVRTGNVSGLRGIGSYSQSDIRKLEMFLSEAEKQTNPAFSAPVLALPDSVTGIGNVNLKELAKDVLNVWKKVMNWIFKIALPGAAPFFIYTFLKKKIGKKTDAKKAKQDKVLGWMQKVGKFDNKSDLDNAIKSGITKKFGKTPATLLAEAEKGKKVAGVGVVVTAIVSAVSGIVEIISKIASVFKKKKSDTVDASVSDAADFDELANESKASLSMPSGGGSSVTPLPTSTGSGGGGGSGDVMKYGIIAAAGLGLYLLTKK